MECHHTLCLLAVSLRMPDDTDSTMVIIGIIVGTLILTAIIIITNIFLACRRARQANLRAQAQSQDSLNSQNESILEPPPTSIIAARRRLRSSPLSNFHPQPPAVIRMQRAQNIPGLSLQELNTVAPVKPYSKTKHQSNNHNNSSDHDAEENTCAVCLEEMKPDSMSREMPDCTHVFHTHCIEEWVTKANRCPVCNTNIIPEDKLQKIRSAIQEGRDPNAPPPPRQRRRRTRAPNGGYHLHDAGETIVNPDQVQSLQSNTSSQQQQQQQQPQSILPVGTVQAC